MNKRLGRKIWNSFEGIPSYGSYRDRFLQQLIPSGTKSGIFLGLEILGMVTLPIYFTEFRKIIQERHFILISSDKKKIKWTVKHLRLQDMLGFNDLKGVFQLKWFCNSMIVIPSALHWHWWLNNQPRSLEQQENSPKIQMPLKPQ